jgi:hypothetical protein
VEFGQLITSTSNNENYGWVEGSGAYEEGEIVTLKGFVRMEIGKIIIGLNMLICSLAGMMVRQKSPMILYILIRQVRRTKHLSVNSCV